MIDLLVPDFNFQDERGLICQLTTGGWNQVNIIVTKAGSRRGRMHYHKKNIEAFYIVSGKVKYKCKSIFSKENEEEKVFAEGAFWSVKPYVGHDFYFLKDTILVSMYSMGVDLPNGTRDIIEMEDI